MNDDVTPAEAEAPPEEWALVEIFGHRQHYGRIVEVERFGTKLLRVDEPTEAPDTFKTHFYSGGSIFSITPITEQTARRYHERYRPRPVALPAPDDETDQRDGLDYGDDS